MARPYMMVLAEEQRLKTELYLQRQRLREISDPLSLPETNFRANFRLTKEQFASLCQTLLPVMPRTKRTDIIRPELKILAAVAFYGNGCYQKNIGAYYHLGLSQSSVSSCIEQVTEALNTPRILKKFINFPMSRTERESRMRKFTERFAFPGVVGAVDGTHVAMVKPNQSEECYFNRKMYHSLNVMIICDDNLQILHIDASFGGASHDSHIWNQSPVRAYMEGLHEREECWLLGDSGYAQRPWLMTPVLNAPLGSPEEHYTKKHCSARNVVERCIGVLKARWRCLLAHRVLHYAPVKAGRIVNACAVLHNIVNDGRLEDDMADVLIDRARQIEEPQPVAGVAGRQAIIDRLWRNRNA